MEIVNEQTPQTAQPVDTEKDLGASEKDVSLGKFKDVQALLYAYNSQQAEFTKRCQRLKELEESVSVDKAQRENAPTAKVQDSQSETETTTPIDKKEVLKEYLKGVMESKQKAVIMDGGGTGVASPVKRPSTIAEAGMLAKEILM